MGASEGELVVTQLPSPWLGRGDQSDGKIILHQVSVIVDGQIQLCSLSQLHR